MSDPNGMVLHEVFGSDLDSGEEQQLRRNLSTPSTKPSSPSSRGPASSSTTIRKMPVMPDSDSDDDLTPTPKVTEAAARRPIEFSDSDDDDEPASTRRRSAKEEDGEYADDESDDEPRKDRKRDRKRSRGSSRPGKKAKKARMRRGDEDDERSFIEDDVRRGERNDDDVVKTEGGWHVSDEIEDNVAEEERRPKKPMNAFEQAMEENKALRRPRSKEIDPKKVEAECIAFLERMMQARDDDVKAYRAGKPALNKLKMLRDVELMAMKVSHREQMLDNMLLAIIKAWLDPMPDGALPNVQIRGSLLQILLNIRVDDDWVERLHGSQGLGKVIHFLSIKDDHQPNRRLADKLMKRWARPVYQSNNNFHDLLDEFDRPEEGRRAPRDGIAAERKAARETVRNFQTAQERIRSFKHKASDEQILATVPRRTPFLFTALAEGSASIDEKAIREMRNAKARNKKVNRTMSTLRRANKTRSARAAKPSVNGRR